MDQRRVLLAFVLMAVVLIGSQWWYGRLEPPAEESTSADTTAVVEPRVEADLAEEPESEPPASPVPADTTEGAPADSARPPALVNRLLEGRPAPSPITVETPFYRMTIDPRGGVIRQVELLRYASYQMSGAVQLVPAGSAFLERSAELGDRRVPLDTLTFVPSEDRVVLAEGDTSRALTLSYASAAGRIEQWYRFASDGYAVDYRLRMDGGEEGILETAIGPNLRSNEKNPREDHGQLRAVARIDGKVVSVKPDDAASDPISRGGDVAWAGLRSKYFVGVVLAPRDGTLSAVEIGGEPADSLPRVRIAVRSPIRGGESAYRVYFGPQEYHRLAAFEDGLDDVNQYGWSWLRWMITPFAKAIVVVMLWLHRFVPNYGLVLLLFGVLVRLAMWPLTTKSFRSIQAMQKIQPEIQRLRERYKDDPQRMQQETMRLYREKKVNPLGGCLPNLIPMPILFALFFVFQSTIEFRGQPFLWLSDLSQPDPLYILPILMGLTMLVSSKMTQSDPKMAAMTYMMPVVLTFVFLNLASGLVLYYTVSNVITFVQQWMLRRGDGVAPEPRPAEG